MRKKKDQNEKNNKKDAVVTPILTGQKRGRGRPRTKSLPKQNQSTENKETRNNNTTQEDDLLESVNQLLREADQKPVQSMNLNILQNLSTIYDAPQKTKKHQQSCCCCCCCFLLLLFFFYIILFYYYYIYFFF